MVITTKLLNSERNIIKADLRALFLYGAAGSADVTATAGQTALTDERFRDNIDGFGTAQTDTVVASLIIGAAEGNSVTYRETGWFDTGTAGTASTMWIRVVINDIDKTSDIQLYLDTTINIQVVEV